MIKTVDEAINFIEAQRINNTSLEDFKRIFEKYDNFHKSMHYIHITGTNGKGSTSKMLSDVLINNNYDVGLFTSPHMIVSNDRIRINNQYISDDRLIHYVNKYYEDILAFELNFFQIYTLIALSYFYDEGCNIAIIEVGIGGLLDSTNVIDGIVSIITNINYDHTEKLGHSIAEIAYQKAGIIKNHAHVITMVKQVEALKVIEEKVKSNLATLHVLKPIDSTIDHYKRVFTIDGVQYHLNSLAKYQVDNALIVLECLHILKDGFDYQIDDKMVKTAFESFEWIGRFEWVSKSPEIILDGAHNIAGIKALIESDEEDSVVIFSALKDKDYKEMLTLLKERYDEVVFSEFDFYRSLKKEDIKDDTIMTFSNIKEALAYIIETYPKRRIILCGSLYFISDARKYIKGEFHDSNN